MTNDLGLTWALDAPQEIRITLVSMHGSADAFTQTVLKFPDTPQGQCEAALALKAIPLLSDAIALNVESNTEDYCEKVAKKLPETTADALVRLLGDAVVGDCLSGDTATAVWVAMVVERHTGAGVHRALFNGIRYLALTSISTSYLKPWA